MSVWSSIVELLNPDTSFRYYTNSPFEPKYVQLNSGLSLNYSISVAYTVRFAGFLAAGISGRYTFSFTQPYQQPQSFSLSVDGLDVSKLQFDGSLSVLAQNCIPMICVDVVIDFCCGQSHSTSSLPEHLFGSQPNVRTFG